MIVVVGRMFAASVAMGCALAAACASFHAADTETADAGRRRSHSSMEVWPGIHCETASVNGREAHLDDIVVTR